MLHCRGVGRRREGTKQKERLRHQRSHNLGSRAAGKNDARGVVMSFTAPKKSTGGAGKKIRKSAPDVDWQKREEEGVNAFIR